MTKDDIIRMWREVCPTGLLDEDGISICIAVAAAEREACAEICDAKVGAEYATGKVDHNEMGWTQSCAASIRARGHG